MTVKSIQTLVSEAMQEIKTLMQMKLSRWLRIIIVI